MIYQDIISKERCWVFIKKEKKTLYEISITGNIKLQLKDENLVYCRLCSDTLTALGLCLVLRKLSHKSLEKVIQKANLINNYQNTVTHD
jgi:hypothetical protein